jgi:cytochrome c oxidase cbb3-type subunit 3
MARDPLMDHQYDGIQEYDNPMPAWWTWTFVVTIAFAGGYWLRYHALGSGSPVADELAVDLEAARAHEAETALASATEADIAGWMNDAAMVDKGAAVFKTNCVACHGDKGEGKIGPNLTDSAWIYGQGGLVDLWQVVGKGVPEKGMPAWSKTLKPADLQAVVATIATLRNTNVPGKAPQGTVAQASSCADVRRPAATHRARPLDAGERRSPSLVAPNSRVRPLHALAALARSLPAGAFRELAVRARGGQAGGAD